MAASICVLCLIPERGERPSGLASSISLSEVTHGYVRSETGWATFQMNDQKSSLHRPSEGTLKYVGAWVLGLRRATRGEGVEVEVNMEIAVHFA